MIIIIKKKKMEREKKESIRTFNKFIKFQKKKQNSCMCL